LERLKKETETSPISINHKKEITQKGEANFNAENLTVYMQQNSEGPQKELPLTEAAETLASDLQWAKRDKKAVDFLLTQFGDAKLLESEYEFIEWCKAHYIVVKSGEFLQLLEPYC
jgi:hypothetical protein